MNRRLLALALAAAALVLAAAPAGAAMIRFQTPSKRIGCLHASGLLRCDMLFLNDRAVLLGRHGKARLVKVTDTVADPGAPILRYGRSRRVGIFTCTSRRTGLTCRNRANGHGFTISRERRTLF